ncbi:MAG: hypothetical protein WC869_08250 [Phycisphaerae bacterium]|jgi:hypothetical protein
MTTTRYKTEAQLCKDALQVQDACNLAGVLLAAHEGACFLLSTLDTDAVSAHPAMRLFASKIASLTGMQGSSMTAFHDAYTYCESHKGE